MSRRVRFLMVLLVFVVTTVVLRVTLADRSATVTTSTEDDVGVHESNKNVRHHHPFCLYRCGDNDAVACRNRTMEDACNYNNNQSNAEQNKKKFFRPRFVRLHTLTPPFCPNPTFTHLVSHFSFHRLHYAPRTRIACYAEGDQVCAAIAAHGHWEFVVEFALRKSAKRVLETMSSMNPTQQNPSKRSNIHYLDIGANVGYLTFAMASAGHKVTAFEMMPSNLALLHISKCLNPMLDVTIHGVGLSDAPARCAMVSHGTNQGDASVECGGNVSAVGSVNAAGYVVRGHVDMQTLDALYPEGLPYPSVVKMDVEGHEPRVLRGALRAFSGPRRPHVILSEVWKSIDVPSYVASVEALGYTSAWVERKRSLRTAKDVAAMHSEMSPVENIIFTRDGMPHFFSL